MKKIALTLALLIALSVCTFNVPVLAEDQTFVVTFMAMDLATEDSVKVFENDDATYVSRIIIQRQSGYVLKQSDIPEFHIDALEKPMRFSHWDIDPLGYQITSDTTFVATFVGENMSVVKFVGANRIGNEPENPFDGKEKIEIAVETGHVLTEEEVPDFHFTLGTLVDFDCWEPNPIGATVTQDITFTAYFWTEYTVSFNSEVADISSLQFVRYGLDAVPPELPEIEGYLCLGWDKPYTHIVESVEIFGIYWQYGDVNMDSALNTGDAGMLLNYAAKLSTLDEMQMRLGDYNKDGAVNVGDAAAILAFIVGVN